MGCLWSTVHILSLLGSLPSLGFVYKLVYDYWFVRAKFGCFVDIQGLLYHFFSTIRPSVNSQLQQDSINNVICAYIKPSGILLFPFSNGSYGFYS